MALSGSLTFLSASQAAAYSIEGDAANRAWYNTTSSGPNHMHTSFVGINNVIVDPITGSQNTLGYPLSSSLNSNDVALAATGATDVQYINRAHIPNSSYGEGAMSAVAFNALMLHRNGPYQHPSWKQIRGGEHAVARKLRLNNTMSVDINEPDPVARDNIKRRYRKYLENATHDEVNKFYRSVNFAIKLTSLVDSSDLNSLPSPFAPPNLKQYYETPVLKNHKPIVYNIVVNNPNPGTTAKVRSSLLNQMHFFDSEELNKKLKIAGTAKLSGNMSDKGISPKKQQYYTLLNAAKTQNATNFVYSQTVFPRKESSFRPFTLEIPEYDEVTGLAANGYDRYDNRSFWRDQHADTLNIVIENTAAAISGTTPSSRGVTTFNGVFLTMTASSDGSTRTRTDGSALNAHKDGEQNTNSQQYWLSGTTWGTQSIDATPGGPAASIERRRRLYQNGKTLVGTGQHRAEVRYIDGGIIASKGLNWFSQSYWNLGDSSSPTPYAINHPSKAYVNLESYNPYPISLLSMWPLDPRPDVYPGVISRPAAAVIEITDYTRLEDTEVRLVLTDAEGNTYAYREGSQWNAEISNEKTAGNIVDALITSGRFGAESMANGSGDWLLVIYQKTAGSAGNANWLASERFDVDSGVGNCDVSEFLSTWGSLLENFSGGYDRPPYLTSSIGGRGTHIGLTPHRMKEYYTDFGLGVSGTWDEYTSLPLRVSARPVFNQILSSSYRLRRGGQSPAHDEGAEGYLDVGGYNAYATASYLQLAHLMTGTAGELVYSTKPTIFFPRRHQSGSIGGTTGLVPGIWQKDKESYDPIGYAVQTASLQYNRHTFPYNTPFYATDKVRGRGPFFNSYSDYERHLDVIARDYSVVAEYRASDHVEYYYKNYFLNKESNKLYKEVEKQDTSGDTEKRRKIVRIFDFQPEKLNTKLNFLSIDGLPPQFSSSFDSDNLLDSSLSTDTYNFDNLLLTTSLGILDSEQISYTQNSSSVLFHEKYSHFEAPELSHLIDEPFNGGVNAIPSRISFRVDALKKLLPKKELYPVMKTVQIGNNFKIFLSGTLISHQQDVSSFTQGVFENAFGTASSGFGELAKLVEIERIRDENYRKPGMMQAYLEPMCAPGILYNSIKSGIAVDYPVYMTNPVYHAPLVYFSGSFIHPPGGAGGGGTQTQMNPDICPMTGTQFSEVRFTEWVTQSFNYGGFQMMGASRCVPAILNRAPDHRLPFEALYNLDNLSIFNKIPMFLPSDFVDLDYSTPNSHATASSIVGTQNPHHPGATFIPHTPSALIDDPLLVQGQDKVNRFVYEYCVNNFLSETMNFFLADQEPGVKLPVAASQRKSSADMSFNDQNTYYMEVSLKMGRNHISCEGPRSAGQGGVGGRVEYETAPMMMRGYIYGPPIEYVQASGATNNVVYSSNYDPETGEKSLVGEPVIANYRGGRELRNGITISGDLGQKQHDLTGYAALSSDSTYYAVNLQDPAYQAFTPPYFYGNSSLFVTYKPADALDQALGLGGGNSQIQDSVMNIWGSSQGSSFYVEEYVTGSRTAAPGTSYSPPEFVTSDMLCKYVPGTGSTAGQGNVRMKIEASMDIYGNYPNVLNIKNFGLGSVAAGGGGPVTPREEHVWYICPKWVCPVLDFSSSFSSVVTRNHPDKSKPLPIFVFSQVTNSMHDERTGRGLWGGYGTDPYGPAMKKINNLSGERDHLSKDDNYEKGIYFSIKFPFYGEQQAQDSFALQTDMQAGEINKFATNRQVDDFKTTGSLVSQLGFEEKQYEIGRMAPLKTFSEAVVVIPYLEEPILISPFGKPPSTSPDVEIGLLPGNEIYQTREIIPGKHFLPIHKTFFENILSMKLIMDKDFLKGDLLKEEISYVGFESSDSIDSARQTDIFKLCNTVLGDVSQNIPGYDLPPELNFFEFLVNPFQMFVIPIEHTLDKQELVDIYQGVMPDSSLRAEKTFNRSHVYPDQFPGVTHSWVPRVTQFSQGSEIITHLSNFGLHNFMSSKPIVDFLQNNYPPAVVDFSNSFVPIKNSKDFYSKIKFMTFKVKQKSIRDYDRYKKRQIASVLKIVVNESVSDKSEISYNLETITGPTLPLLKDVFGYNWPYDNMSLIHSIKLDIEMEID